MDNRIIRFFLLTLLCCIGIFLSDKAITSTGVPAEGVRGKEVCEDFSAARFSVPDHTREVRYSFSVSMPEIPVAPQVGMRTLLSLPVSTLLTSFNKLLMKHSCFFQSSPKRFHSLRLLPGEAHPGPAKAYYIYALRHLII